MNPVMRFLAQWWVAYAAFGILALLGGLQAVHNPEKQQRVARWFYGFAFVALFILGFFVTMAQHQDAAIQARNAAAEARRDVGVEISNAISPYQTKIDSLNQVIGGLKIQLSAQGKDVQVIKESNIVTGRNPVKVEVTNTTLESRAVPEVENTKLLKTDETSKYPDAPYASKLVLQSNVAVNPARFAIYFANEIQHMEWNPAQGTIGFTGEVKVWEQDRKVVIVNLKTLGDAAIRPESPLIIHVTSAKPIKVVKFERGPQ